MELKPCPFCESEDFYIGESEDGKMVYCAMCEASGPVAYYCDGEDDIDKRAIELWNWRNKGGDK